MWCACFCTTCFKFAYSFAQASNKGCCHHVGVSYGAASCIEAGMKLCKIMGEVSISRKSQFKITKSAI